TVEDAALVLAAIAGPDPGDPQMRSSAPADVLAPLHAGVDGLRIGVIRELVAGADTDADVRTAVLAAAEQLRTLGAKVEEISLPLVPLAGAVFMALADSEGAGAHQPWLRERASEYD